MGFDTLTSQILELLYIKLVSKTKLLFCPEFYGWFLGLLGKWV